jgi:hypothetical protein
LIVIRYFLNPCDHSFKDAFRIVPVSPHDYHLLGFTWRGQFYYKHCLPMGAKSSCQIFEQLSTALQWVMLNRWKAGGMSHILDDFFFMGPPNSQKCRKDLEIFLALCGRINIPVNMEKTFGPVTRIIIRPSMTGRIMVWRTCPSVCPSVCPLRFRIIT